MEYREALREILVVDDGLKVVPELYTVPDHLVKSFLILKDNMNRYYTVSG